MSANSAIEWTNDTWNPVTGCSEVTPGCDNCYAKTFAERWRGTPGHYFEQGFDVQLRPDKLRLPLTWRKPRRVFVNSMSDLFHDAVPDEYIARVFATMAVTPRHTYQLLTKRHGRMRSWLNNDRMRLKVYNEAHALAHSLPSFPDASVNWPLPNLWVGVSVEDQKRAELRIPALIQTPAAVTPMFDDVDVADYDQRLAKRDTVLDGFIEHFRMLEGEHGEVANMLFLEAMLGDEPPDALAALLSSAIRRLTRLSEADRG